VETGRFTAVVTYVVPAVDVHASEAACTVCTYSVQFISNVQRIMKVGMGPCRALLNFPKCVFNSVGTARNTMAGFCYQPLMIPKN